MRGSGNFLLNFVIYVTWDINMIMYFCKNITGIDDTMLNYELVQKRVKVNKFLSYIKRKYVKGL